VSAANYRARSATELVDGAVQLLRANLSTFVTLGAVFYVPVLVVQWTLIGTLRPPTVGSAQLGAFYSRFAMVYPFFVLWTAAWYTVIFTVASDVYLGRAADIGSAFSRGLTRIAPTLGVSIVKAILVSIGMVFFLIPGIILALFWFATPASVILEPIGMFASFGRSSALSRGVKGHVFKAYLIAICIFLAAYFLMILIGAILGIVARVISPAASTTITMIIVAIGMMFIYPLWPILSTLLYYDARIRNEGFDIELMSRTVSTAGAPATA
jgi:hypothetical protein